LVVVVLLLLLFDSHCSRAVSSFDEDLFIVETHCSASLLIIKTMQK